jgi:hypothetical protein
VPCVPAEPAAAAGRDRPWRCPVLAAHLSVTSSGPTEAPPGAPTTATLLPTRDLYFGRVRPAYVRGGDRWLQVGGDDPAISGVCGRLWFAGDRLLVENLSRHCNLIIRAPELPEYEHTLYAVPDGTEDLLATAIHAVQPVTCDLIIENAGQRCEIRIEIEDAERAARQRARGTTSRATPGRRDLREAAMRVVLVQPMFHGLLSDFLAAPEVGERLSAAGLEPTARTIMDRLAGTDEEVGNDLHTVVLRGLGQDARSARTYTDRLRADLTRLRPDDASHSGSRGGARSGLKQLAVAVQNAYGFTKPQVARYLGIEAPVAGYERQLDGR